MSNFVKFLSSFGLALSILLFSQSVYAQGTEPTTTATTTTPKDADTTVDTKSVRNNTQVGVTNNLPATLKDQVKTRNQRIKEAQIQRKEKFSEIQANYKNLIQKRNENKSQKLEQRQEKKLEMILFHGALVEARFERIIDHLYKVVAKIDEHLTEQKDAGFDVSVKEKSLDAIESEINALDKQVSMFSTQYGALTDTTDISSIRANVLSLKQSSKEIVNSAKKTRVNIKSLISGIR